MNAKISEWKELYALGIGMERMFGSYISAIRVPGGIIYRTIEDRTEFNSGTYDPHSGAQINNNRPAVSVSIAFTPFPPGLYEKLSQL